MFRNKALNKGHLKVIKARTGTMVGQNVPGGRVDYVQKGGGFYDPRTSKLVGGLPAIRGRGPKIGFFRKLASDIRNVPGAIRGNPIDFAKGTTAFGLGGGVSRFISPIGIYNAIDPFVGQYIDNPYARIAVSTGLTGLASLNPYARAAGLAYAGAQAAKNYVIDPISKSIKDFRATPVSERAALPDISGEASMDAIGTFDTPSEVVEKVQTTAGRKRNIGGGRIGFGGNRKREQLQAEGDELVKDEFASIDGTADIQKIQEKTLGGEEPPGADGITNYEDTQAENAERDQAINRSLASLAKKDEKKKDPIVDKPDPTGLPPEITGVNKSFDDVIALSRRYFDEIDKGQTSQAKLVFLANLASGLLTGTTKKAGIGGALEVFGQAIGPAVNNYATLKLKEGELRQNRREASLNAALDHMKFLNDAAKAPPRPETTPGVIQVRGTDGVLRNYNGFIDKFGTAYLPGGLVGNQQQLIPVPQGGPITTSDGQVVGRFEKFLDQKNINKRLSEIEDTLGNRYTAYSVTLDILKTIRQKDEEGKLVQPGIALTLDTYLRRIGNAAADLAGRDLFAENAKDAEKTLEQLYQDEVDMINNDVDLSEAEKKQEIEMIDFEKIKDQRRRSLGKRGWFSGLSAKDQEKLAVQETSLVYALANTFKDQDRLTQRDINAAREIVNIFALARGGQDVRDSITAIANQLRADIRRQELLYTTSGGLFSTITNLKELAKYTDEGAQQAVEEAFGLKEIEETLKSVDL
tara:strand:+ start:9312 stop:11564 length:2253 start_codon:yes stop_codon:yes gene_type:complete